MNIFNWKFALHSGGSQLVGLPGKFKDMFRNRNEASLNEVLFYGAEDEEQRRKLGLNNLLCIYYILIHASDSIDICAPSLASDTIVESLMNVRQKGGVRIRIAIHHNDENNNLKTLTAYGIEVKAINSAVQLEHEFILIDAVHSSDAVAIIGPVDYEVTRVNCNRDTTVITSEVTVVSTLKREFERVWSSVLNIEK